MFSCKTRSAIDFNDKEIRKQRKSEWTKKIRGRTERGKKMLKLIRDKEAARRTLVKQYIEERNREYEEHLKEESEQKKRIEQGTPLLPDDQLELDSHYCHLCKIEIGVTTPISREEEKEDDEEHGKPNKKFCRSQIKTYRKDHNGFQPLVCLKCFLNPQIVLPILNIRHWYRLTHFHFHHLTEQEKQTPDFTFHGKTGRYIGDLE